MTQPDPQTEALDRLATNAAAFAEATREATAESRRVTRITRLQRWFGLGVGATLVIVLITVGYLLWTTRGSARDAADASSDASTAASAAVTTTKSTAALARLIESCTTPDGECAKRQAKASEPAIAAITDPRAHAAAAWCGAHTATLAEAEACAVRAVRALPPIPSP